METSMTPLGTQIPFFTQLFFLSHIFFALEQEEQNVIVNLSSFLNPHFAFALFIGKENHPPFV